MTRLLAKASLVSLALAAYIASPFATAWFIREAVRNGDAAYLAHAIDWPSVRTTLKPTLGRIALNLPDPETSSVKDPGMWQRFKAYWGQGAVNTAIDGYMTPEGLTQLFSMRETYRNYVTGEPKENTLPVTERMQRAWARVKRAEFTSLTTFEVDMADKHDDNRIYLGKLELTGLGWKLKELRVKLLQSAEDAVVKFVDAEAVGGRGGFISRAAAAAARTTR